MKTKDEKSQFQLSGTVADLNYYIGRDVANSEEFATIKIETTDGSVEVTARGSLAHNILSLINEYPSEIESNILIVRVDRA